MVGCDACSLMDVSERHAVPIFRVEELIVKTDGGSSFFETPVTFYQMTKIHIPADCNFLRLYLSTKISRVFLTSYDPSYVNKNW